MSGNNVFYSIEFLEKLKANLPETFSDEDFKKIVDQNIETAFFQLPVEKRVEMKDLLNSILQEDTQNKRSKDEIYKFFSQELLIQLNEILDS